MTAVELAPGESTFGSYAAFIRRRRVAVAGGLLCGFLAGLTLLTLGPKTYSATTDVLVLDVIAGPAANSTAQALNLDDEAQILTSSDVVRNAAGRMGERARGLDLSAATEVTVPANSTIVSITFRAPDPETARLGAQSLAESYLDQRHAEGRAQLDRATAWLQMQRAEAQEQLQTVLARLGTPEQQVADPAVRAELTSQLGRLRARLTAVLASVPLGGRVVADAMLPRSPRSPVPALVLVSGAMLGLLGGCALGALRDLLGPRILTADDVRRRTGAPVLTVLRHDEDSAQDVTRLANLVLDECDREPTAVRSFLVVSTSPRVRAIAEALVEALRRAGRETSVFRPEMEPLIPGGSRERLAPARPHGRGAALDERVDAARTRGDIVVIDAPATGAGNLAPLVADALVVVVDLGETRPEVLDRALTHHHRDHHRLTGIVGVLPAHRRRFGQRPSGG